MEDIDKIEKELVTKLEELGFKTKHGYGQVGYEHGDILSARDFVALSIEYSTQYNYVLRFICRLTKSISVSYDKSAQTIEILGNMLENINDLVPCYFNDGLSDILSEALRDYLSVFERAIG